MDVTEVSSNFLIGLTVLTNRFAVAPEAVSDTTIAGHPAVFSSVNTKDA